MPVFCLQRHGQRIERLIRMIQAGRVHPGKLLNYKFEGFDKIEDAFKLMDSKPKDLSPMF